MSRLTVTERGASRTGAAVAAAERRRAAARLLGLDRLSLFVPAVMSVGLLFWIVSELMAMARARAEESRDRRAAVAASAVVDDVLGRPPRRAVGARPRRAYLLIAVSLLSVAVYVTVGSIANYRAWRGYVNGVAWLLAVALVAALVATAYGVTALVAYLRWPPPDWVRGVLLRSALGSDARPAGEEGPRPVALVASLAAVSAAALVVALFVISSPELAASFDEAGAAWFTDNEPLGVLRGLDPVGRMPVVIGVVLLAGLAALRCRVLAAVMAMSAALGLAAVVVLRPLADHARPPGGPFAGQLDAFPAWQVLLSVVIAGTFPLVLAVLVDRLWVVWPAQVVLGLAAFASATHRIAVGEHWPTDVLGGALLGLVLVLVGRWLIADRPSHRACHHCPWSTRTDDEDIRGAVAIHPSVHSVLRAAASLTAALATTAMLFLAVEVDLPEEPAGYGLEKGLVVGVQVALAVIVGVAALVSWRWAAVGAVLIALAAAGAGILSSIEYRPGVAVLLTGAIMVPAVLLWLSWQHRRRPAEIVAVAVATSLLLGGTWAGATAVYDHYFGPTHPASTTPPEPVDRIEWLWAGALRSDGFRVTGRLARPAARARLRVVADGQPPVLTEPVNPDPSGMVTFEVERLRPSTTYEYRVVVDGREDGGRGHGAVRTAPEGPASFTFTVGACAVTGSNGAVFDAIRAERPLFNLVTGDLHYENIASTDPERYLDAYGAVLSSPAQAALARATPFAYVWDDHDFGPNDADASSPGRSASRQAYRTGVPHYPVLDGDAPIQQAFTIGRVRIVMTDTRSERTPATMLGPDQERWLVQELEAASRTHALVVWVSSVPWIGPPRVGADYWAGWPEERARIAEAIAARDVDNLVMLSGDAHMVALDDGTNTNYGSVPGPGFPVLASAALDRAGSVKGGPYSGGTFPGGGQYGVVDVVDDGRDVITVRLTGKTWEGRPLVSLERTFAVPVGARTGR